MNRDANLKTALPPQTERGVYFGDQTQTTGITETPPTGEVSIPGDTFKV